jgi:hypothetical protein
VSARSAVNAELQALARQIVYHVDERRAFIWIKYGGCTEMTGAISLCTRLDPSVHEIIIISRGEVDCIYGRDGKTWQAKVRTSDDRWLAGQPFSFDGSKR